MTQSIQLAGSLYQSDGRQHDQPDGHVPAELGDGDGAGAGAATG
jgi:hypothetical protein